MNVLVINLKRSEARMSFMSQQLERLNISFIRVEAVDANNMDDDLYQKYAYDWDRVLRRSEVACFLSHKKAWEYIIRENEPFVIFEDDVILSKGLVHVLDQISDFQNYDFINLETSNRKKLVLKNSESLSKQFSLSKLLHNKSGAAAYILSPKYAHFLLLNYQKNGLALADAALYDNHFNLSQYQLVPAVAIQVQECVYFGIKKPFDHSSNIAVGFKPECKSKWLIFKLRRIRSQLLKVFVHLIYLLRSHSVKIPFDRTF